MFSLFKKKFMLLISKFASSSSKNMTYHIRSFFRGCPNGQASIALCFVFSELLTWHKHNCQKNSVTLCVFSV